MQDTQRIKFLEEALADYVERYGFSQKAREYFLTSYWRSELSKLEQRGQELH